MRWLLIVTLSFCLSGDLAAREVPEEAPEAAVDSTEREIRDFLAAYGDDLRQHRTQAIADRYDSRGVFFLGHGNKDFETFEDNREYYLNTWKGPRSFAWQDLSIEVLSPDAAVVLGKFEWGTEDRVGTVSYSALLLRHDGQWRIRSEAESSRCQ